MAKRVVIGAVVMAVAIAAWWFLLRTPPAARSAPMAATGARGSAATAATAPTTPIAPTVEPQPSTPVGYRRLDPAARRALMDRIARVRTAGRPSLPAGEPPVPAPLPGTLSADELMQAVVVLIPAFKDCYAEGRAARAVTHVQVSFAIHVVGEADVGTLIDAVELDGDEAFRADPELATCLRETMLAVELPPLAGASAASFKTRMVLTDEQPAGDGP